MTSRLCDYATSASSSLTPQGSSACTTDPFVVGSRSTPIQAVAAFRRALLDYPHGLDFFVEDVAAELGGKNHAYPVFTHDHQI